MARSRPYCVVRRDSTCSKSQVLIVIATLDPSSARRKLARTRAATSMPSPSMTLSMVIPIFAPKAEECRWYGHKSRILPGYCR